MHRFLLFGPCVIQLNEELWCGGNGLRSQRRQLTNKDQKWRTDKNVTVDWNGVIITRSMTIYGGRCIPLHSTVMAQMKDLMGTRVQPLMPRWRSFIDCWINFSTFSVVWNPRPATHEYQFTRLIGKLFTLPFKSDCIFFIFSVTDGGREATGSFSSSVVWHFDYIVSNFLSKNPSLYHMMAEHKCVSDLSKVIYCVSRIGGWHRPTCARVLSGVVSSISQRTTTNSRTNWTV